MHMMMLALLVAFLSVGPARGDVLLPARNVELRIAAGVPEATAEMVRAAVASQLAGLATLTIASGMNASDALGVMYVEPSAQQIVVRIVGLDGRPLAPTRRVPGPLAEASASEIASIAHAFVRAASEGSMVEPNQDEGSPAPPSVPTESARQAAPPSAPDPRVAVPPPASAASSPASGTDAERGSAPVAVRTPSEGRSDRSLARSERAARASWRLRMLGLYSGGHESAALGWQHGLRAETVVRLWRGVYAGAGYVYVAPTEVDRPAARVRVQGHGFSSFVGIVHGFGNFGLAGDLGFGLARSRRETLRTGSGFAPTPDAGRWDPRLALRAHALLRIQGVAWLAFDIAPAFEVTLTRQALVVAGDAEPLSAPRSLRARLDVGACFEIL